MAHEAGNKGKDLASMASNAKDMASNVASNVASTVAQKAGDAASYAGRKAEDAASGLGSGMKSLAGTIREHTPDKGMLGSATSAVADTLESGGRYLQEHGLSGIGDDMTNLIRRNPIPAVLVGIGIGFLLARATRS
jgi:hypothetical protein